MPRLKNFRLQKVLEFKEHLEVMSTLELHRAQTEQKEAENELNKLHSTKAQHLQNASEQFTKQNKVDLADLQIHLSYIGQLNDSIAKKNQAIKDLAKVVDKKRNELNEAVKERKIIQTLKDQFTAQQKQEEKKLENEKIDEIALRQKSNAVEQGVR